MKRRAHASSGCWLAVCEGDIPTLGKPLSSAVQLYTHSKSFSWVAYYCNFGEFGIDRFMWFYGDCVLGTGARTRDFHDGWLDPVDGIKWANSHLAEVSG